MTSDKVKTSALLLATKMWRNGTLNVKPPSDHEYQQCLSYLKKLKHGHSQGRHVKAYLNNLLWNNIGEHFNNVANHRKWVGHIYELLIMANAPDLHTELGERIKSHNLWKYGLPDGDYQIIENPMLEMNTLDLQENILDMMAKEIEFCRGYQYHINWLGCLSYGNYHVKDRNFIRKTLDTWIKCLHDLVTNGPFCAEEFYKKTGKYLTCIQCDFNKWELQCLEAMPF